MNQEDYESDLNCSICMLTMNLPCTLRCGHSFCKGCIKISIASTKTCPLCRQSTEINFDNLSVDVTINAICKRIRQNKTLLYQKSNSPQQIRRQIKLPLLEAETDEFLLPYTRVTATVEQIPVEPGKQIEGHVIVRQQAPFNTLGVLSKVQNLRFIGHGIYACLLVGQSFCRISDVRMTQEIGQNGEFYYFKRCLYNEIVENKNVFSKQLNSLIEQLQAIEPSRNHSKRIDSNAFKECQQNPLKATYSAIAVLSTISSETFQAITSFNHQDRLNLIRNNIETKKATLRNKRKSKSIWLISVFVTVLLLALLNVLWGRYLSALNGTGILDQY